MNESKCCKVTLLADASKAKTLIWANFFAGCHWSVEIISRKPALPNFMINEKVKIHSFLFSPKYPFSYFAFIELIPRLLLNRPDVIHAHNFSDYGVIGALFRRILRFKPLALTATGKDILQDARTHKGWSIKHTVPLAELLTCDDEAVANELVKMGALRKDIFIIKNYEEDEMLEMEQRLIEIIEKVNCR